MSTHFIAYTVDDAADGADAVAIARHMDPPEEAPTIDELRERIDRALYEWDGEDEMRPAVVARILEIVTLGMVPE